MTGTNPAARTIRARRSTGTNRAVDPADAARHHNLIRKTHARIQNENHYQVLGVPMDASLQQIREAYFKLAKDFHPDRVRALGLDDVANEANVIIRRINEAHRVLTSQDSRKVYDAELSGDPSRNAVHNAMTAEFVFQKGLVALRRKNFSEALLDFQEAVKLNPKEGEHVAYVAWTQFSNPKIRSQELLPRLKTQLREAVRISPNSATCHYFLGEVHLALGEQKQAYFCFNRVVEIKPDHIEASRHLRIMRMRQEKEKGKDRGLFGRFRKK